MAIGKTQNGFDFCFEITFKAINFGAEDLEIIFHWV